MRNQCLCKQDRSAPQICHLALLCIESATRFHKLQGHCGIKTLDEYFGSRPLCLIFFICSDMSEIHPTDHKSIKACHSPAEGFSSEADNESVTFFRVSLVQKLCSGIFNMWNAGINMWNKMMEEKAGVERQNSNKGFERMSMSALTLHWLCNMEGVFMVSDLSASP